MTRKWLKIVMRVKKKDNFTVKLPKSCNSQLSIYTKLCIMFKIIVFFIIKLFIWLYVRIGIVLLCRKHMHNHIISLRGEIQAHITSLPLPLFIEVPVTSQECERSCICVLVVLILLHSTILILDFGNVLTVQYFFVFFYFIKALQFINI